MFKTIPLKHYVKRLRNFKKASYYLLQNSLAYTDLDRQIINLQNEIELIKRHNAKTRVRKSRAKKFNAQLSAKQGE